VQAKIALFITIEQATAIADLIKLHTLAGHGSSVEDTLREQIKKANRIPPRDRFLVLDTAGFQICDGRDIWKNEEDITWHARLPREE